MKTRLFRLAFRVLPRLPRTLVQVLAVLAAEVLWLTASGMRARVRANLAHIPTLAADPRALDRVVRRSFRSLLLNYIDLFTPPDLNDPRDLAQLTIENRAVLTELQNRGQGCILLSLHSNGFERGCHFLPRVAAGQIIGPMEVISPPELFTMVLHSRSQNGIKFLPITASETLREMITGLRSGAHVVVALDRDVLHTGIEMPFFGANARIPTGPVALSRMTGAPIIIMSLWRTGFRRLEGHVIDPGIIIGPEMRGEAATRVALTPLVGLIEREILRHPEGWLAAFADDVWVAPTAQAASTSAVVGATAGTQNKI